MRRKEVMSVAPLKQAEGRAGRAIGFMKRHAVLLAAVCVLLAAGAAVSVPFLMRWHDSRIRAYSGVPTQEGVMLLLDTEKLGKFEVVESIPAGDGTYQETIAAEHGVVIRLWRDYERPRMNCREACREKYPRMKNYSRGRVPRGAVYEERGVFRETADDGETYRHTALLLRRGGWDYLADFAVREKDAKTCADYIDQLTESMYFIA